MKFSLFTLGLVITALCGGCTSLDERAYRVAQQRCAYYADPNDEEEYRRCLGEEARAYRENWGRGVYWDR